MPTVAEATRFRDVLAGIASVAVADALRAVAVADYTGDAEVFTNHVLQVVPGLVALYGDTAAGYATDVYEQWRSEAGVTGRWRATPAQVAQFDQVAAGLRTAVGPLWGGSGDLAAVEELLGQVVSKHVANGGRDTITGNTNRDPATRGWQRTVSAGACRFCRMLADRGGVYLSERNARFAAHGGCNCSCVPSWDPGAPEVHVVAYVASKRKQTLADRARVKAYLDEHYPE